jgi:hypothetical protein
MRRKRRLAADCRKINFVFLLNKNKNKQARQPPQVSFRKKIRNINKRKRLEIERPSAIRLRRYNQKARRFRRIPKFDRFGNRRFVVDDADRVFFIAVAAAVVGGYLPPANFVGSFSPRTRTYYTERSTGRRRRWTEPPPIRTEKIGVGRYIICQEAFDGRIAVGFEFFTDDFAWIDMTATAASCRNTVIA